jgi:hypothetical protein
MPRKTIPGHCLRLYEVLLILDQPMGTRALCLPAPSMDPDLANTGDWQEISSSSQLSNPFYRVQKVGEKTQIENCVRPKCQPCG